MTRRASFTISLLLFLAVLLGAIFITRPLMNRVQTLRGELRVNAQELSLLAERRMTLTSAKEATKSLTSEQKTALLAAVPSAERQDELIRDLRELSLPFDLALHSVSFTRAESSNIKRLTMQVAFTGPAAHLVNFLRALEENPRKFLVKTINLQVRKNEKGVDAMNLSLTLDAFYAP